MQVTSEQIVLFVILGLIFLFLIWGRWRYDLVAFGGLVAALIAGVVPVEQAFVGFGHPATVVIALVLVISRGLSNAGVVELVAGWVVDAKRQLSRHIAIMAGLAAALSALMNNVAALALLMPVDLEAAKQAKRSPASSLMPLSFASILGGLVTLIGTPPNIVIASFRERATGEGFAMFDFAPVGLVCAVLGVAYVALVGWRLLPKERLTHDSEAELFKLKDYVAELAVTADSPTIGKTLAEIEQEDEEGGVQYLGLVRGGKRLSGGARWTAVAEGDLLVVQADPEAIERLSGTLKLSLSEEEEGSGDPLKGGSQELLEVVVPEGASIQGRALYQTPSVEQLGVRLLGVSRQGQAFRQRIRRLLLRAGDILLLYGPAEALPAASQRLGTLPLASRGLQVIQRQKAGLAVLIFAATILLASFGVLYLAVALAACAFLYVLLGMVPLRELYQSVEWSVIVLLGALIPIGNALESSGGTALIAAGILDVSYGAAPWVVLTLLMVVTMTLSDVMNNTATAVIAAPIAFDIAGRLEVDSDPFLMTVAVAASCAFLTPIGHKNNTLIMGPGGYRFGDYWRMGLPLEVMIVAVAVPAILLFWPL